MSLGSAEKSLTSNLPPTCFAGMLAQVLNKEGYKHIIAGGYPGSVHPTGEHKSVTVVGKYREAKLIPTHGLCNYWDGNGNRVPNPRNQIKAGLTDAQLDQQILDEFAK